MNININDAQGFLNVLNVLSSMGPGQFALVCDELTTVLVSIGPNGQVNVIRAATVLPMVDAAPDSDLPAPDPVQEQAAADQEPVIPATPLVAGVVEADLPTASPAEAPEVVPVATEPIVPDNVPSEPINPNDVPLSSTGS